MACFGCSFVDTKNRLISCKDESLALEFFYPALLGALAGLFTVNAVELLSPQQITAQRVTQPSTIQQLM